MPNVIDYQTGERIDPVTGKPIKRVTTGAVPTNFEDMLLPVSVGADQFYAPGFGSNLIENFELYDDVAAPPAPKPVPQAPAIGGQLPNPNQGNSVDARNDDKSNAGAINNFGDWVDAIMHGTTALGVGGPIQAAVGQATGELDYGDTFGNANMEDPNGWNDALAEAEASLPPGAPQQQIIARASTIYGNTHPGWGGGAGNVSGDTEGLGSVGAAPNGGISAAAAGDEGMDEGVGAIGDNETLVDPSQFGTITTASGTKPPKPTTTKPTGNTTNTNAGGYKDGGNFGSGTTQGSGADPSKGDKGGGHGSGSQPDKPDTAGSTAGGEKANPGNTHFARGGYVQNMPTSVAARTRPMPNEQPVNKHTQPQRPGAIKDPPRQPKNPAFAGLNQRTGSRFSQSSEKGFAQGGFVPKAGYQHGGAVSPEGAAGDMQARFNPSPEQIADDGVIDNQPIQADEGEFVITREAADILGPEILNGLNNPETALILSDLVEDVLALQAGTPMGGAQPQPGPMGMAAPTPPTPSPAGPPSTGAPPTPSRPMMGDAGANPSQGAMPQQRTAGVAPSGYRKGGYVTAKRGSLANVRC